VDSKGKSGYVPSPLRKRVEVIVELIIAAKGIVGLGHSIDFVEEWGLEFASEDTGLCWRRNERSNRRYKAAD
jgi:hypothetical protein